MKMGMLAARKIPNKAKIKAVMISSIIRGAGVLPSLARGMLRTREKALIQDFSGFHCFALNPHPKLLGEADQHQNRARRNGEVGDPHGNFEGREKSDRPA